MLKALVLFGSESDELVYKEIFSKLKDSFELELKVLSAHRNPDELEVELKKDEFDFIIAGAGIAAHLPGVCASKTNKPVFGVPVEAYLAGLDAYLSIAQMPYGVPVACLFVNQMESIKKLTSSSAKLNVFTKAENLALPSFQSEIKRLLSLDNSLDITSSVQADSINIKLLSVQDMEESLIGSKEEGLPIFYVPILDEKTKQDPSFSLKILDRAKENGLWFCTNNSRNAYLFANKILNLGE